MKIIKKIILFLCFSFFMMSFGQVSKFTATSVATKYKSNGGWTEWSKLKDCEILTSINLDANKIKIYSEEIQEFDIISFEDKEIDEEGDELFKMYCEDKEGINCSVDLSVLHSQNKRLQLYIRYKDLQLVYNLVRND